LLVSNPDGRIQIRDAEGKVLRTLNTQLVAQDVAIAVESGWVVTGSLPESIGRDERGAAVRIGLDGSIGPRWLAPGLFRSLATAHGVVLASDLVGPVYSLQKDGSLAGVPVPPEVQGGSVDAVVWGNEFGFCKKGDRSMLGEPHGVCLGESGRRVRAIWSVPPIACGEFLVGDVQADGRATSAWSRVVWSGDGATQLATHPLSERPTGIACANDLLVDVAVPGQLLTLPGMVPLRDPLCSNDPDAVVVGTNDVWCLRKKRRG